MLFKKSSIFTTEFDIFPVYPASSEIHLFTLSYRYYQCQEQTLMESDSACHSKQFINKHESDGQRTYTQLLINNETPLYAEQKKKTSFTLM